jgi:RNA polymerase sigma-70 factor (ECF subfamily)
MNRMSERSEAPPQPSPPAGTSTAGHVGRPPGAGGAPSDEALLAAYAAGDADAFVQLYDRHARATWRFIRHRLGQANEAAADTVLENSWIDAALGAPHLPGGPVWTPWLYALVRRHAIARLTEPGAAPEPGPAAEPAAPESDPKAQARAFLAGLARLPAPAREAVVLQLETGLDAGGIAAVTGERPDEVEARLREAMAALRELAGPHEAGTYAERVARAYAQAWAMRDASSRGPSSNARDGALATARAVVALRQEEARRAGAAAARAAGGEDVEPPLDFLDAINAKLQSALHDGADRAPPREPVYTAPAPSTGLPPEPPEPTLAADAVDAARLAELLREQRPAATKPRSTAAQVALVAVVALAAGAAGWLARDMLGRHPGGPNLTLADAPTAAGRAADETRRRLDEALARAEAALGRASAPAATGAGTTASAPAPVADAIASSMPAAVAAPSSAAVAQAPPVATAAAVPASSAAAASAVALAAARAPEAAPSASARASKASEAGRENPRLASAAPASRASPRVRAAARQEPPAIDPEEAVAAAQARADAFLGRAGGSAAPSARSAARESKRAKASAEAAVEAARARAEAFLAGSGASSSSR